ncbi:hypothetical protein [Fodinibius sp.]|uniref:hypothetical protein n=1 Tax=Fodinibius sp. TaxID=1872440 RepID=UPI002ACD93D0|nr:hypothetical protein [Fodinibius sp.]MDZ7659688.1 hypothetical protein [Fodinibius sp.]
METFFKRLLIIVVGSGFLLLGVSKQGLSQETDTSSVTIDQDDQSNDPIQLDQRYNRSVSGGALTDMGTYNVPNSTQYYQAPFEAQKELDQFMEEYRKEMEKSAYWHFLRAVSPYIRLHLGVRDFNTLNIVGRDNPLWQSYSNDEEIK